MSKAEELNDILCQPEDQHLDRFQEILNYSSNISKITCYLSIFSSLLEPSTIKDD